jgi:hypothetical protein
MAVSARTQCPQCDGANIINLATLLYSPRVDFFRCCECLCWWQIPKGEDGPASRAVLADPDI